MKYIRTKDGIYELNNDVYIENNEAFMRWFSDGQELESDSLGKIKAEADTIEELCDEFVVVLNHSEIGKEKEYMRIYKSNLEYSKLLVKDIKNSALYGAIWTDKGLIYVAKLNEEGELELI